MTDFTEFVNLASRALGAGVVAANDEWFAEKENMLRPEPAVFDPAAFGPKGKIMDGWETRRRRSPGHDWSVVRLGAPGAVRGIVIDTSYFRGNYPPYAWVEACAVEGYPSAADLSGEDLHWVELVPRSALNGDSENSFAVEAEQRFTHLRLSIDPDGGVARFRAYGVVVPDPRMLAGRPFDLAAQENGGVAVASSDRFYSSPHNLNAPGHPRHMGEGWETRRRRGEGNDWVLLQLGAPGVVDQVEIDTSYFLGNAPGAASLRACDATQSDPADEDAWWELLPRTDLQPDTRHKLVVKPGRQATHVRIDVFPDGGLARLRLYGAPTEDGWARLAADWLDRLPLHTARTALDAAGVPAQLAAELIGARPIAGKPEALRLTEALGLPPRS